MNIKEYKKINRAIVFRTNSLFTQINYKISEQFELDLRNSALEKSVDSTANKPSHRTIKSHSNVNQQTKIFNAVKSVIEPFVSHLNRTFKNMEFEIMLAEEEVENNNFSELICCAVVCVASRKYDSITADEMSSFRDAMILLLEESNALISSINNTTDNDQIKSIILCTNAQESSYSNPICYEHFASALFTDKFFNCLKELTRINLSFTLNNKSFKLENESFKVEKAIRIENSVKSSKQITIQGEVILDVPKYQTFSLSGNFVDEGSTNAEPFKRIVSCLNKEELDESKKLFDNLIKSEKELLMVVLNPVQNYVCIAGRSAKIYKIHSFTKA